MPRASRRIVIESLPDCTYRVSSGLGNGPTQSTTLADEEALSRFLLHAVLGSVGTLLQIEVHLGELSPTARGRIKDMMSR